MKAQINQELWKDMNIFSKIFLVVGMYCVHISFLLAGLEQEDKNETH